MNRHAIYYVPQPEVARRVVALQEILRAEGTPLVWIDHLADRLYFSGSAQDGVLLVPDEGEPVFFVRKSKSRAACEASVETRPYPGRRRMLEELRARLTTRKRLGLAFDVTRAAAYVWLREELRSSEIVDVAFAIRRIRAVKSAWEITQIRSACQQVDTMYREISDRIGVGMTELELTGHVEGCLRRLGHSGTVRVRQPAADITMGVVVSGDSGLNPTSFNGPVGAEGPYPPSASGAGWKKLAPGETVMLDVVTSYNGYHGDTTRTFFLGDVVPDEALQAHEFCLEILAEIRERMRPGVLCSDLYREVGELARRRGEPQGFMGHGENRVRFFGHGVGLELDELPVLAEKITLPLAIGSVLAVEPKAFLPGIGPVGVENTYVVQETDCESLSGFDEAIIRVAT